ncbi:MAG: ABC transporter permease, partial [Candidatus Omnitrophota bacterium]
MNVFKEIVRDKVSLVSLGILLLLYIGAIFAPFFSPYPYDEEDVEYLWAPPVRIHFFDFKRKIFFRPFVYA